jgi:hypothetical protein
MVRYTEFLGELVDGSRLTPLPQKWSPRTGLVRFSDKSGVERLLLLNSSPPRSGRSIRPSEHRNHELGYWLRGALKLRI